MATYDILKFFHILTVVFMSVPLYNLIVVNERVLLGKAHLEVDRYFENIIRGGAVRCYNFQLTALVTGILLIGLKGAWFSLFTNWVLLVKFLILLLLMSLLSVVHFHLQPRIDGLLAQAEGDAIPANIGAQIGPYRLLRKRLAAVCLFLVVVSVLLGLQIFTRFPLYLTLILLLAAVLFSWRVYSSRLPFGWF